MWWAGACDVVVYGDSRVGFFTLCMGFHLSRYHQWVLHAVVSEREGAAITSPLVSRQQKFFCTVREIRDQICHGVSSEVQVAQLWKQLLCAVLQKLSAVVVGQQQVLQILETSECVGRENLQFVETQVQSLQALQVYKALVLHHRDIIVLQEKPP